MSVIQFPARGGPLTVTESLPIYNLLMISKAWARSGTVQINEFVHHDLIVFAEMKGELHMYQKGTGENDHLLFWAASTEIGEDAAESLLDVIFQGSWVDD